MKVLVVLVLAVFTGCNADPLVTDKPRLKLDELTDAFWEYLEKAAKPVEDVFDGLSETKFGEVLEDYIEKGFTEVTTRIENVDKALNGTPSKILEELGGNLYDMAMSLERNKENIEKNLEPVLETLAPVAQKIFSVLTEETEYVRNITSPYVKKLVERVDNWSKELPARLDTLYDSLQKTR